MALLSTGILGSSGLTDYEEKCCPEDQQLTFDYDSPVELLCEIPLSGRTYDLHDLQCDGVSVEEGLNLLDQVHGSSLASVNSVPSPGSNSDCSWDSGLPGTAEEQFLAGLFGTDLSLHPHTTYSPTPSPTDQSTFSYSQKPTREAKSKNMAEFDEVDYQGDQSRGGKVSETMTEKNRKNAEAARQNRLKKKKYMEDLEKNQASLKTENVVLKAKCHEYQTRCQRLQSEVAYLHSVLANDSALASLLENIPNVPKVKLTSSLGKRPNTSNQSATKMKRLETTGGVCLHVAKDSVSLEFCDNCSKKASQ